MIIIKVSKTQLPKIVQWGGLFGSLSRPLLKTELLFLENVLKTFTKIILILLW